MRDGRSPLPQPLGASVTELFPDKTKQPAAALSGQGSNPTPIRVSAPGAGEISPFKQKSKATRPDPNQSTLTLFIADWLATSVVQNIAAENNFSETTFFTSADDEANFCPWR